MQYEGKRRDQKSNVETIQIFFCNLTPPITTAGDGGKLDFAGKGTRRILTWRISFAPS